AFNDPYVAISEGARPTLTLREVAVSAAAEITAKMVRKQSFREEVALARQYFKQSQADSHPEVIAHLRKRLDEEWDRTLAAQPGVLVEATFCLNDIGASAASGLTRKPMDAYESLAAAGGSAAAAQKGRPLARILDSMAITEYRKKFLRLLREG